MVPRNGSYLVGANKLPGSFWRQTLEIRRRAYDRQPTSAKSLKSPINAHTQVDDSCKYPAARVSTYTSDS